MSPLLASCGENATLTVKWWDNPPFWMKTDGEMKGIMFDLLKRLLRKCCRNATIDYTSQTSGGEGSRFEYDEGNRATFSAPVCREVDRLVYEDEDEDSYFLAAIHSPGLHYLVDDDRGTSVTVEVLMQAWPLVIIILLAAAYAGLIIWILDTYWNPDHFPRTFISGFSEGIWWAFVTMTTVGYGDRTPRSLPARLFTVVWILVGIVILSVFTATITASLSSDAAMFSLQGKTVGVIKDSSSYRYAVTHGAIVKEFDSFTSLNEHYKSDLSMDGIIMENFEMLHFVTHLQQRNIENNQFLAHGMVYGILAHDIETRLARCFQSEARRLRDKGYRKMTPDLENPENRNEAKKIASKILAPQVTIMVAALGGFILLFLCTMTADCLCLRKKNKNATVEVEMHPTRSSVKAGR